MHLPKSRSHRSSHLRSLRFVVLTLLFALLIPGIAGSAPLSSFTADAAASTPLLLITDKTNSADPFGPYLEEILRAEGFSSIAKSDLADVNASALTASGVVLLGPVAMLSPAQVTMFTTYVQGGGQLIAMHPPAALASQFGVMFASGTTNEGYLGILNSGIGAGFPATTLQLHAPADHYTLAGATSIASLYSNATTQTPFPAVTLATVGQGQAMLWSYDLAQSVVFTRQGNLNNPAITNPDGGYRTTDLFSGYVDLNNVPIPQADEQQRLLAKGIETISPTPLPHSWYFPQNAGTVLVLTADSHGNLDSQFAGEIASVEKYGAHISIYLSQAGQPEPSNVTAWMQAGHTFGIHPYPTASIPDPPTGAHCGTADGSGINAGIVNDENWFQLRYNATPAPTSRIHELAWQCWTDVATDEANAGISMDTSYYAWGSWLKKPDGGWAHGFVNGSGLPMQMMDASGKLIPVYQQETSLIDEQLVAGTDSSQENLNGVQAAAVSQQLIDASLIGDNYAALMTQFHVDYYNYGDVTTFAESTMAYAQSKGVPIWNADEWLRFTKARAATTFGAPSLANGQLTFNVTVPSGPDSLPVMVPIAAGKSVTAMTVDGAAQTPQSRTVKGMQNAIVLVPAGSHTVVATFAAAQPTMTPTATSTLAPTVTPVPTGTPIVTGIPATPTGTATVVSTGTSIPTSTTTSTVTPISTTTPVPTVGATSTPVPTATAIASPPPTATAVPTASPTPVPPNQIVQGASDFPQGTFAATSLDPTGQLTLTPKLTDDFPGTTLNSSLWNTSQWNASGTVALTNSNVTVDGAGIATSSQFSQRVFEARVKFTTGPPSYQNIGWSPDFSSAWILIGEPGFDATHVYARINPGTGNETFVQLPATLDAYHTYRIDWQATKIDFYVDGALATTVNATITTPMNAWLSSGNLGHALTTDWARVWQYDTPSGTFTSAALDAGATATWQSLTLASTTPTGTTLTVQTRTSSDGTSWSALQALGTGNTVASPPGRYLQYQLAFTGTATLSPALSSVTAAYQPGGIVQPTGTPAPTSTTVPTPTVAPTPVPTVAPTPVPTVTAIVTPTALATNTAIPTSTIASTPIPTATGTIRPTATGTVKPTATSTVKPTATSTVKPTATSTVKPTATSTVRPTAVGTLTPTVAPISTRTPTVGATSTPVPTATAIASPPPTATAVPTASPTPVPPNQIVQGASDFPQGTFAATSLDPTGQLTLTPKLTDDFPGTTLNSSLWNTSQWNASGTVALTNSNVTVDGAGIATSSQFSQRVFEARVKFTTGPPSYQNIGWSPDFSSAWILIGEPGFDATHVYARINPGTGNETFVQLPATLDAYHTYRIDWQATKIDFYVDGALATTVNATITTPMNAWLSSGNLGHALTTDWARVWQYDTPSGTFTSAALDAGATATWQSLTLASTTPTGTTLTVQTRTSSDGTSWSALQALGTGNTVASPPGRYLQYQLAFTGTATLSPALSSVTASYTTGVAGRSLVGVSEKPTVSATAIPQLKPAAQTQRAPEPLIPGKNPETTSTATATRSPDPVATPVPTPLAAPATKTGSPTGTPTGSVAASPLRH